MYSGAGFRLETETTGCDFENLRLGVGLMLVGVQKCY